MCTIGTCIFVPPNMLPILPKTIYSSNVRNDFFVTSITSWATFRYAEFLGIKSEHIKNSQKCN